MPTSLPIISWNGVSDPSSTSLIRVIFSSITLFRSGDAVEITSMNISIISTTGVMKLRTTSTFFASISSPFAPRSTRPSEVSSVLLHQRR